ncbi:MAG TPA: GNAT family N-acetyltransferase [Pyrinomonadaceae bacterium]|nr:GNAT family N-acetyltransferase [Pyrinomonadaceae bacterium]
MLRITQASSKSDIEQARELFQEYEAGLGISLCFQNFAEELANLPGEYAPPRGRLLLAHEFDQLMGCVALRPVGPMTCEMKRLFVRPAYRDRGLGRVLVEAIIEEARKLAYTHLRLDTLPGRMERAIELYRSIGFVEIEPYYDTPVDSTKFMELDLLSPKH